MTTRRTLSEFIAEFPLLNTDAGGELADIAEAVINLDRKGSLTLKIDLEKKGGRIMSQVHVVGKPPRDDPEAGLWFLHPDRGLTKEDPYQGRFDQVDPDTGEVRTDD